MTAGDAVTVARAATPTEAHTISVRLAEAGIDARVIDLPQIEAGFGGGLRAVPVLVKPEDELAARAVLSAPAAAPPDEDPGDETAVAPAVRRRPPPLVRAGLLVVLLVGLVVVALALVQLAL